MIDRDTEERAAYQRAVALAKDEIARLQADNQKLREELTHRAEIDAEDMHRIQDRYSHLQRQFDSLQKWVARGMALQPAPPIVMEGVDAALLAELGAARAVVALAREWMEAVETLDGVYAAEQALIAALKARNDGR